MSNDHAEAIFYLTIQVIGAAGLIVLLVTSAWIQKKKRNPLLVSLYISWALSLPCTCLLYFTKYGFEQAPPPRSLCIASAVLVPSQSILAVSATASLVIYVLLVVRNTVKESSRIPECSAAAEAILLIVPYILFIVDIAVGLVLSLVNPSMVSRDKFYCVVHVFPYLTANTALEAVFLVSAIVIELWIIAFIWWHRAKAVRYGFGITFLARNVLWDTYLLLGLALDIVAIFNYSNVVADLFYATTSTVVFLIFGMQENTLEVWSMLIPARLRSVVQRRSEDKLETSIPKRPRYDTRDLTGLLRPISTSEGTLCQPEDAESKWERVSYDTKADISQLPIDYRRQTWEGVSREETGRAMLARPESPVYTL